LPRNYEIAPGLSRFSKARLYHKRGLYQKLQKPIKAKSKGKEDASKNYIVKPIGGDNNGKERKILVKKGTKLAPVLTNVKKTIRRNSKKVPLRKSITPGTILILLAGRHRGKRVVFLKQLEKSGLLLVTGPMKLNAVPLRRVAQAFVIATKTKLDISKVAIPDHLNDDYFKKKVDKNANNKDASIFAAGKSEYTVTDQRKTDQKNVDSAVLSVVRAQKDDKKFLFGYLGSRFSLAKGQHPHNLVF